MTTYTQDLAAPLPVVLQAHTGNTTTLYLFDMGTRPLAEYDSAWEYLLPDGLGSVRQLVDASGNVKLAESYEPYGSVLSSQGSATSAFGFTGEQLDSYIELMFLRARYMQPTLGVFLSHDPWSGNTLRPLTYNGWAYVDGNPVNRNDPSGYCGGGGPSDSKARVCGTATNDPPGLAFRTEPRRNDNNIKRRLPDGTQVQLLSDPTQSDGLSWRHVSVDGAAASTPDEGYVADVYLEPVSGGGGGTGERWWPFGEGVGYLKGWRFEWTPSNPGGHPGIDLISANDPSAGGVMYSTAGFNYALGTVCSVEPDKGREVFAVHGGFITNITKVGPTTYDSYLIDQTLDSTDGNKYWVQYTHVKAKAGTGRIEKGTPIGWYGFYGAHGGVAHLHLTLRVNNQLADPEGYLPDAPLPLGPFPIFGP